MPACCELQAAGAQAFASPVGMNLKDIELPRWVPWWMLFWQQQLETDGGQLQVALEAISLLLFLAGFANLLPGFVVGSWTITLLSFWIGLILAPATFAVAYGRRIKPLFLVGVADFVTAAAVAVCGLTVAVGVISNAVGHSALWILFFAVVLVLAMVQLGCLVTAGMWAFIFGRAVQHYTKAEATSLFGSIPHNQSIAKQASDDGGLSSLEGEAMSVSDYEDGEQVLKVGEQPF